MKKIFNIVFFFFISYSLFSSNYYWVGGTGNWSDYTKHWASKSGGQVFHVQEPTPFDNVIFDTNSFLSGADTVFIDSTLFTCNDMSWTGVSNKPVFFGNSSNGTLQVYGNFILDTGMIWNYKGVLEFSAVVPGKIIISQGNYLNTIFFNGRGSWQLQDSLNADSINMEGGDLFSNGQTINCNTFYNTFFVSLSIKGSVHLGTSAINIFNWWIAYPWSIVDADSATINMYSAWARFQGGGKVYKEVNFKNLIGKSFLDDDNMFGKVTISSNILISANNTFDTLYCNNPGQTITIGSGTIQKIVDTVSIHGLCSAWTTLNSTSSSGQGTISKLNANVAVSYLVMQDVNAAGGAVFTADHSTVVANVTGWTLTNPLLPKNLYWVRGTGNWDDVNHWDTISGGPGGHCVPSPLNNVFFDANSFTGPNAIVHFNPGTGYCRDMDWTGTQNNPQFIQTSSGMLKIYGSLTFISGMSNAVSEFAFSSLHLGNMVTSAGKNMGEVEFNGVGGGWALLDALNGSLINISVGTFHSNNQTINAGNLWASSGAIYFGTSVINAGTCQMISQVHADSTTINTEIFYGGNNNFHNVNFSGNNRLDANNTFDNVSISGDIQINSGNTFNTLKFNTPGQIITLASGSTQTINASIAVNGTCTGLTVIQSSIPLQQAVISKVSGNVAVNYVLINRIPRPSGSWQNV